MRERKQNPSVGPNWKKPLERRNDFGRKKEKGYEGRLKLGNVDV